VVAVKEIAVVSANATGVTCIPLVSNVNSVVIAPVDEFFEMTVKPFSDLTGPLKVVLAIIPSSEI
jgi:hypothetical protein